MGGRTALLNGPDGGHTVGQTMDGGEQGAQHDQISPRHLLLHEDLLCTLAEAEDQNVPGGSHRGMQNPIEGLSTEHRIRPVVGQSLLRCRQQLAGPGGTERNVCERRRWSTPDTRGTHTHRVPDRVAQKAPFVW